MSIGRYILKLSCPDQLGIVATVGRFHQQMQGNIVQANHHSDFDTGHYFLRQEVVSQSSSMTIEKLRQAFEPIAKEYQMQWTINDTTAKKRVVLFVSKYDHCLADLLYRWRSGELHFDLRCVISNHEDCKSFVAWHGVDYHTVAVPREDKQAAFDQIDKLVTQSGCDTIVLARYMQILPPALCQKYSNQIINIHHSFLPSFVGAKPYHQAYARGVKFVGATCHYVTSDLDEGPIIEQDAMRTNHADTVEELIRLGRDVEKSVLARGLRYHLEDRVFVHQNKTVVFD